MKQKLLLCLASLPFIFLSGCSSIAKQNVISAINTGIGFSLAENPQTQMYEAKLGYIRSQFYSVPTGKTLCEDCQHGHSNGVTCVAKNDADKAVELVAGIRVNSSFQHLFLGADITESFAIGATAVNSPAAVAMYISQAKSDKRAEEAAVATRYSVQVKEQIKTENDNAETAIKWLYKGGTKPDKDKLTTFLKNSNKFKSRPDLFENLTEEELRKKLRGPWHIDFVNDLWPSVPPQ